MMAVLSVRSLLGSLDGDLPATFRADQGLRTLLPRGRQSSISTLRRYRYMHAVTLSTSLLSCEVTVKATGSGNWGLAGTVSTVNSVDAVPLHYAVGFAFNHSDSQTGHGGVVSGEIPIHFERLSRSFGTTRGPDPWITQNWPTAFSRGITVEMNASDDVAELINALRVGIGMTEVALLTGGEVTIFF